MLCRSFKEESVVNVNAEAPNYDSGAEPGPDTGWTNTIRDAVKDFVGAVGESTKQLTGAAERFANESFMIMDEATQRAERAAATSSSAATTAAEAATEAQRASDLITEAVTSVGEKVREEARQIINEAVGKAEQVVEAGERLKVELQQRITTAVEQTEKSASATQAAASVGIEAAKTAAESATTAQQAYGEVRETAERIRRSVETIYEAMNAAQQAASEARQAAAQSSQHAWRAEQAVSEAGLGGNAREVLERLEQDYQLLTRLVQDMHGRTADGLTTTAEPLPEPISYEIPSFETAMPSPIDDLSLPSEPVAEAEQVASEPESFESVETSYETDEAPAMTDAEAIAEAETSLEETAPEPAIEMADSVAFESETTEAEATSGVALEEQSNVEEPTNVDEPVSIEEPVAEAPVEEQADAAFWAETTAKPATESEPAAEAIAATTGGIASLVSGKLLISISPVPDFDRLLNLDGALGRMASVRNVSLADYAKEEVTFRIEIDEPLTADEFARRLGESAQIAVDAVSADEGNLALHIR
jgi:hypothetical protein